MNHAECPENSDPRLTGSRSRPAARSQGEPATAWRCWQWSNCQDLKGSYDVDVHTVEKQHSITNLELHLNFSGLYTFQLYVRQNRKHPNYADGEIVHRQFARFKVRVLQVPTNHGSDRNVVEHFFQANQY
jgi:hypothetical protein